MVELLSKIDPKIYEKYVVIEHEKTVCMQPSITFCMGSCELAYYSVGN